MKRILLGLLMLAGLIAPAHATCTLPYQLQNGKIADANQVMANFNALLTCTNSPALSVMDGLTTVQNVTVIDFTTGATVTSGGAGIADVAVSGGGGGCFTTPEAVQYNNSGTLGCAPFIVNGGVMDFTASTGDIWQVGGSAFLYRPFANFNCFGIGACTNVSSNNGPMDCFGDGSCGNVTSDGGDYTALGDQSCGDGSSASGGASLVCVGYRAGQNLSGANLSSTYIGSSAGRYMNGSFNASLGDSACQGAAAGSTATGNTCLGHQAGAAVTTGSDNLFAGFTSGAADTTGEFNVFVGFDAGNSITTGSNDICIGFQACEPNTGITTGSRDIMIATGNTNYSCAPSSASVNDEFDLCGNGNGGAGDHPPIERCNIASISAGHCVFNVPLAPGTYTVATLPVSPPTGSRASVTDATACTFGGTPTGGSTTFCGVVYTGAAWLEGG